ncbi:MAG: hypothetical protein KJO61_00215 [Deltaproteobacteria bacterium]|nr:hypothetical protein [Deltaproteobacteria bacterium]
MLTPPKQFENSTKYEHIIQLAQDTRAVLPPDGFTRQVMENLPPGSHSAKSKFSKLLSRPFKKQVFQAWIEVETEAECAFCFLLAGFFYLIMGVVMAHGLDVIGRPNQISPLVMLQPAIAFASSFVFIILGVSMLKKIFSVIKIAYFMTLLYIGFSIFNAIVIQLTPQSPFTVTATLFLTSGAVLLGVFLTVIIHKYEEMVAYDEIFI